MTRKRQSAAKQSSRFASRSVAKVEPLRIIGGCFGGRKLAYNGLRSVRPMKERVREATFNLIGPSVKGGQYGDYPETRAEALDQGDLVPSQDFRGVYSTILDDWLGLDPVPIVDGQFERPRFITSGTDAA